MLVLIAMLIGFAVGFVVQYNSSENVKLSLMAGGGVAVVLAFMLLSPSVTTGGR